MATTQKEKNFACSPLKEHDEWKPATALGGIAENAGMAFERAGYPKAYHIVGQYLLLSMDEELFKRWIYGIMQNSNVNLSMQHCDSAHNSVKLWCQNNL